MDNNAPFHTADKTDVHDQDTSNELNDMEHEAYYILHIMGNPTEDHHHA